MKLLCGEKGGGQDTLLLCPIVGRAAVSKRPFNYHRFLVSLKLHIFETITAIVVIIWLMDFAIKETRPALERIVQFFHSP